MAINHAQQSDTRRFAKTVLLLLAAGVLLTTMVLAPNALHVAKLFPSWRKLNQRKLRYTVRRLRERGMVTWQERDGAVTIRITEKGKQRALHYRLQDLTMQRKPRWDGRWRLVIFDIPDTKKNARDALRRKLKEMDFVRLQESVFVTPYPCKEVVDFIAELYEVYPYVRLVLAQKIDQDADLQRAFHLARQ